jgi:cilia- and flagella-associated protein 298
MLGKHGVSLPVNMQGLTDEQIMELKLTDEYADKCIPMDGYVEEEDAMGRRNGRGT